MASLRRRDFLRAGAGASILGVGGFSAIGLRAQTGARLIVLGGDLVEIVYALGAGDRVVATDDTGLWPPEVLSLPKVGYLRRLSPEGVLSLGPDIVLANPDAGPATAMDQLVSAGLRIEIAPDGDGFASIAPKIRFVGEVLDLRDEAAALAVEVETEMARVDAALAALTEWPTVLFLMSVSSEAPVASGTGTSADAMIRLAHGRNAVEGFEGYKTLSAEAALGLAPDAVLLPSHAGLAAETPARIIEMAGLRETPAGRAERVVVMDGLKLLGFGPRTPSAVTELARALHPGLSL